MFASFSVFTNTPLTEQTHSYFRRIFLFTFMLWYISWSFIRKRKSVFVYGSMNTLGWLPYNHAFLWAFHRVSDVYLTQIHLTKLLNTSTTYYWIPQKLSNKCSRKFQQLTTYAHYTRWWNSKNFTIRGQDGIWQWGQATLNSKVTKYTLPGNLPSQPGFCTCTVHGHHGHLGTACHLDLIALDTHSKILFQHAFLLLGLHSLTSEI